MSAPTEHDDSLADDYDIPGDHDRDEWAGRDSTEQRWSHYAVLMVDKKATTAEINAAYKRLSLQFHPDKHISPGAQKAAENLFHRIKRARDVLCDEQLRRIYDALGSKGLEEFENQQVATRDMKSSREIIEEYERLLEMKNFQEEMNSYNPHATTEVHLDMCCLFESGYYVSDGDDEDSDIGLLDQLSSVDCTTMKLQQGFTLPVGKQNHISIDSSLLMNLEHRNRSAGSLSCFWRRSFSHGFLCNAGVSLGNTSQLSLALSKQINNGSMVSGNFTCDIIQGLLIPGGGCVFSYQLSKRLKAEISGSIGMSETVKCALSYTGHTYSLLSTIQTGIAFTESSPSPHSVSLQLVKSIPSHHIRCKLRGMKREKRKEEEKQTLERRRLAAMEEAELMANVAQQITEQEESRHGLVIVKAIYGKLHQPDQRGEGSEQCVINVTVPLQHHVKDSSLRIPTNVSKAEMPGFFDPCYGEEKKLYVRYKFHGKLHHVTVTDDEPLYIPKQSHLISNAAGS